MGSNFTLCDSDFFALGHKFSPHNGDLYGDKFLQLNLSDFWSALFCLNLAALLATLA
ncbi:hypothetical protein [Campylobacter showae]|uniref:hypothetical protein n=1 Tax=Campylobacter showae TaxID=204 RepID=UPI0003458A65|nr:hypothetical protein [Campylobacter showae]